MLSKIFTLAVLSAVSAAYAQTAPSSPLSFRTVRLEAQSYHGKDQENKPVCHESAVAYSVTGDRHLDNWVKQQFHGMLPTHAYTLTITAADTAQPAAIYLVGLNRDGFLQIHETPKPRPLQNPPKSPKFPSRHLGDFP